MADLLGNVAVIRIHDVADPREVVDGHRHDPTLTRSSPTTERTIPSIVQTSLRHGPQNTQPCARNAPIPKSACHDTLTETAFASPTGTNNHDKTTKLTDPLSQTAPNRT